ncbi:MAG: hypothetical protein KC613_18690, partial [Myxococcales bacterium]|nr:hypothetical protein [Myxococcales bacterium]
DCDGAADEGFDLASDPQHCGACGVSCAQPGAVGRCVQGQCVVAVCEPAWMGSDCDVPRVAATVYVWPDGAAQGPEPGFPTLAAALAAAEPGQRVVLQAGEHATGPVTVETEGLRIDGEPGAVLRGTAEGVAVLRVVADGVTLTDFAVTSEVPVRVLVAVEGTVDSPVRGVRLADLRLRDATVQPALPDLATAGGLEVSYAVDARIVGVEVARLQQAAPAPGAQAFLVGIGFFGVDGWVVGCSIHDLQGLPGLGGQVGAMGIRPVGDLDAALGDVWVMGNAVSDLQGAASDGAAGWAWGVLCDRAPRCVIEANRVEGIEGGSGDPGGPALGVVVAAGELQQVHGNVIRDVTGGLGGGWAVGVWARWGEAAITDNQIGAAPGEPCERQGNARLLSREQRANAGRPRAVGILVGDDYFQQVRQVPASQVLGNHVACVISDRFGLDDGRAVGVMVVGGGTHSLLDNRVLALDGRHANGVTLVNSAVTLGRQLVARLVAAGDVYGIWAQGPDLSLHNLTVAGLDSEGGGLTRGVELRSAGTVLHSSVIRDVPGVGVWVQGAAAVTVDHVLQWNVGTPFQGGAGLAEAPGNTVADPLHVDPQGADYQLAPGSPAIDGGRPGAAACGEEPGGGQCRLDMGHLGGTAPGQSAVCAPEAAEVCNGVDDDCDGPADEAVAPCGWSLLADQGLEGPPASRGAQVMGWHPVAGAVLAVTDPSLPPALEGQPGAADRYAARTTVWTLGEAGWGERVPDRIEHVIQGVATAWPRWEADGRLLLYGGTGCADEPCVGAGCEVDGCTACTATRLWSPDGWEHLTELETTPGALWQPSLARDRQGVLLFGGRRPDNCRTAGFEAETWRFDGAWTRVCQAPECASPAPRHGAAMAYDPARDVTVLFGGQRLESTDNHGDTWEWDGVAWRLACAPPDCMGPDPRRFARLTFDPDLGGVVLVGGTAANVRTACDGADGLCRTTWLWRADCWHLLCDPDRACCPGVGPRYGQAQAYDEATGVTVVFGGWTGAENTQTHGLASPGCFVP